MATEFDVGLYESISELLKEQRSVTHANRRGGERRAFPFMQLLSPYDGVQLPGTEQLRVVRCHDLSPNGFSFRAKEPLQVRHVIIGLGRIPFQFFVADVVRMERVETPEGSCYHMGCRFVRRITGDESGTL